MAPEQIKDRVMRVRFAPSPTGYLHIGGARTCLFNWLLARGSGGTLVLRIEDTDRARSTEAATQAILDGLRYLGLDWDEGPQAGGDHGPYFQAERGDLHRELVDRLLESGKAYRCFCSRERLEELREGQRERKERIHYDRRCLELSTDDVQRRLNAGEPAAVRFRVPEGSTRFEDMVRGPVLVDHREIEDFILARADGSPVYNLAVVGDDHGMEISHVVRGEDHLSNTSKQILLFEALGFPVPTYGHISLILAPGGGKLSKRHGAVSVTEYEKLGYLPEAMINFLARMGWSYDDKQEIFSRQELIEKFSMEGVVKSGAVWDLKKLDHLGQHYMRERPAGDILNLAVPHLIEAGWGTADSLASGGTDRERVARMVDLARERVSHVAAIVEAVRFYFEEPTEPDKGALKALRKSADSVPLVAAYARSLDAAFPGEGWGPADSERLEEHAKEFLESRDVGLGKLAQPVRALVSGRGATPGLFDVLAILGKPATLARLAHAESWVAAAQG